MGQNLVKMDLNYYFFFSFYIFVMLGYLEGNIRKISDFYYVLSGQIFNIFFCVLVIRIIYLIFKIFLYFVSYYFLEVFVINDIIYLRVLDYEFVVRVSVFDLKGNFLENWSWSCG